MYVSNRLLMLSKGNMTSTIKVLISSEGFVKLHSDLMEEVIQLEFSEYDK